MEILPLKTYLYIQLCIYVDLLDLVDHHKMLKIACANYYPWYAAKNGNAIAVNIKSDRKR